MKVALYLVALAAVCHGAAVPRKNFQDNFQDFLNVIMEEGGESLELIMRDYQSDPEYQQALEYFRTQNFVGILAEMESLPEFNAVIDYLEEDNIQIHYFLDMINKIFGVETKRSSVSSRRTGSGFNGLLRDVIDNLPQASLAALFEEKMSTDDEFRVSITNLRSEEFAALWSALWESEVFQAEVEALANNGISLELVVEEVMALFGQ